MSASSPLCLLLLFSALAPLVFARGAAKRLITLFLGGVEILHLLALAVAMVFTKAQRNLPFLAVDFDDFGFKLLSHLEPVVHPGGGVQARLAHMNESFHPAVEFHEDPEVRQLRDLAARGIADLVLFWKLMLPWIGR